MGLDAAFNALVVVHDLAIQRMIRGDLVTDGVIAARADLVEVSVTLTDNDLPNQKLGCNSVGQLIRIRSVLRTPACRDDSRVAVLHDTPDEQLDVIRRDCFVVLGRVVIPKVLVPLGQLIANIQRNAGFNAVTDIALGAADGAYLHIVDRLTGSPPVHKGQCIMPPMTGVVGIAVTGEGNHKDLRFGVCGVSRGSADADKGGQAQQQCHEHRQTSLENACFHGLIPPF